MQKNFLFTILFCLAFSVPLAQSLSGHITDSVQHIPLEGASIYFPQLKLWALSDSTGNFRISPFPKGTYTGEIQRIGYGTLIKEFRIKSEEHVEIPLNISYSSLGPVIITSLGNITFTRHSPIPVSLVSNKMMFQHISNTVLDALESQPGVNATSEGPGTTKPQINGLGFDRVLVLMDGIPQQDFQWGDDHGLLIDPNAVYDAEIIRGPASLQYGASAEAGVICFKSEPFAASGTLQGSLLSEFHQNNGYIGNALHLGGNQHGFAWNLQAASEESHAYRNPKDGYVWGTAWHQENARLTLGWNKDWGYSRLTLGAQHRRIQVPDGNRDSTGRFMFDFPQNEKIYPTKSDFLSYSAQIASDKILEEYQAWWQNGLVAGRGKISLDIGFTQSVHHDIDSGALGVGNMLVNDIPFSLKYQWSDEPRGIKLTTGFNGAYEFEHNLPQPPAPYISDYEIPNYTDFEIGAFAIAEKSYQQLTLSGGLRYDVTHFIGQPMWLINSGSPGQSIVSSTTPLAENQFQGFDNTYQGWSGSLGGTYDLNAHGYLKANISKSFRAPAINELTSNGLNIGSNAVQLGNILLKPEQGYQLDLAFGWNARDFSFEIDGFYNHIHHFIFADRTDSINQGYPVYQYVSTNTAILTGVSGNFNIHPSSAAWLELDNGFTYIYSFLPHSTDSTSHLPWIPAPHWTTRIRFKLGDRHGSLWKGIFLEIGQSTYWEQNNIYRALNTELPSAGYTLFQAGMGAHIVNPKTGKQICSLYLGGTNLTNVAYADHLNLAQYFHAINGQLVPVTQQNQGIYNMGRNIGIKVIFPILSHSMSNQEGQTQKERIP